MEAEIGVENQQEEALKLWNEWGLEGLEHHFFELEATCE